MAEKPSPLPKMSTVPQSAWQKLSQKKIYFGHQSVGFNIIDGIKDVMKEHPGIKLDIIKSSDASLLHAGTLEHSTVGKNFDPESKVAEFVKFLKKGLCNKADFAGMKFCYVDVRANTDVKNLFKTYEDSITQVEKDCPETTIIHFTVPLKVSNTTWKTIVKKIIGRKTSREDNVKRNAYNKMLLERYSGKEPIFDLAKVESTYPDGRRCTFKMDGNIYYSLVPEYTNDGGHLNELGRKIVAEQFLIFLANLHG